MHTKTLPDGSTVKFYRSGWRRCSDCWANYSPNMGKRGRMPKGYKVCPKCGSEHTKAINCTVPEKGD